jgi:hypothetical protein
MFLKLKLIFRFIIFVIKNEIIDKKNWNKSFSKFNLNSKTYIVETTNRIEVEDPLSNLQIKGYIVQVELVPEVWSDRLDKKFYRSYESASEAIINLKNFYPNLNFKIKPIYILDKAQSREVDIRTVLDFK